MSRSLNVLLAIGFCAFTAPLAGCGSSSGDAGLPTASLGSDETLSGDEGTQPDPLVKSHPVVEISTSLGKITVELDRIQAPITVNNFLTYAGTKLYDRTIFHQVDKGFMALAGGYDAKSNPIPAEFPIRNEALNGLKNVRGTIAMARPADSIDGATTQFFVNLSDNAALDYEAGSLDSYGYCVFGKVTAGMDVLDRISDVEVADVENFAHMPVTPVVIESIRRVR